MSFHKFLIKIFYALNNDMKNNDESLWRNFVDDVEDSFSNLFCSSNFHSCFANRELPPLFLLSRNRTLSIWMKSSSEFSLSPPRSYFAFPLCSTASCLHNTSTLFYKCLTSVFFCDITESMGIFSWIFITFSWNFSFKYFPELFRIFVLLKDIWLHHNQFFM